MAKNLCIFCKKDSGKYRVCKSCYDASIHPCPDCGTPVHHITVNGKNRKRPTCTSCTSKNTSDTRKIGKICKVCGKRKQSTDIFFQVCDDCQEIKSTCPVCHKEMPKYIKRGNIRKYCSHTCAKLARPMTTKERKKAQKTKWKGHSYKTHQNRLARDKPEYDIWRQEVFERDNYTCQDCGTRNKKGNGFTVELHPHHIKPFATYKKLRYEVSNGVTLCKDCHRKRHNHTFIGKTAKTN